DPELDLAKTATAASQNADGSWTVTYEVVVSNTSSIGGAYDLSDTLEYGEGITPTSATWALQGTDVAGTWDLGAGVTTELADGRLIAAEATHTYLVTVEATVAAGVVGTDPGQCSDDDGVENGGFLNAATLTAYGEDITDRDCVEPSLPELDKVFGAATQRPDATWDVTYTLTVDNSGNDATVYYDLDDQPGFASGIEILGQSVFDVTGEPVTEIEWDGTSEIVSGMAILGGAVHRYEVTFHVDVPTTLPDEAAECDPAGAPGRGFFNSATLTSGGDEISDDDCGEVVEVVAPDVAKSVADGYPVQGPDGTWRIEYLITVTSPQVDPLAARYALEDTLDFGEGIEVLASSIAADDDGTPDPLGSWTGLGENTAVTDGEILLPAGETHTYRVRVVAELEDGVVGTEAGECYTGEVRAAGGFLNVVELTSGDLVRTDDACAEPYDAPWTIEKSSDPESGSEVEPGDTITYTVTLRATGEGDPTGVVVTDDLSRVLDNADLTGPVTASIGGVVLEGDQLVWEVGTFSGTATLTYSVEVDDDAFDVTVLNVVTGEGWTEPVCIGTCSTTHFTQGEGGENPGEETPGGETPGLPDTGADVVGLAALGLLLTIGGAMFLGDRRKGAHV
ncbi:LPXTG cell wall anchor domain-containing protein, partial [Georgenia sp. MJ206]|uniref:DUF7927 domain-containing protein n=1 Tax=Georgenia wangjunii TaxID=3117730 RepID=UPI002F2606B4